jgi:CPA2 family monovalent cation:H+ antiporter-2
MLPLRATISTIEGSTRGLSPRGSVALGAFVAGVLVAESGRGAKVEHQIAPLRDVFAAIFFVSIGMSLDPLSALAHLPETLLLVVVVVLSQLASVSLASILSGNGLRPCRPDEACRR